MLFPTLAFCYGITLKQDDQSLRVLRHEGRFPSPATPLIEQVGERILVFSGMTGELDHDSLVFFHRQLDYVPVAMHRSMPGLV
jgi:hypothetical protein